MSLQRVEDSMPIKKKDLGKEGKWGIVARKNTLPIRKEFTDKAFPVVVRPEKKK